MKGQKNAYRLVLEGPSNKKEVFIGAMHQPLIQLLVAHVLVPHTGWLLLPGHLRWETSGSKLNTERPLMWKSKRVGWGSWLALGSCTHLQKDCITDVLVHFSTMYIERSTGDRRVSVRSVPDGGSLISEGGGGGVLSSSALGRPFQSA